MFRSDLLKLVATHSVRHSFRSVDLCSFTVSSSGQFISDEEKEMMGSMGRGMFWKFLGIVGAGGAAMDALAIHVYDHQRKVLLLRQHVL
jgi:hypothetical protein